MVKRRVKLSPFLLLARKTAVSGVHPSHQVGAVLVRGGQVLARAANISRPWGLENPGRHAEIRVLHKVNDSRDAVIYVARQRGTCSKPCENCQAALRAAGIRKMVFFDWNGDEIKEKLS